MAKLRVSQMSTLSTILIALASAVVGGIISPIVLALLQHYFIWRKQKTAEARKQVFDDAVPAIALLEADALKGAGETRPETNDQVQKALALVEAFFSAEAFGALTDYLKRDLSKPGSDLNKLRTTAIKRLAMELGLELKGK
jgi:hypothetical protein